jgi:triacylglycerol lipase
MDIVLLHGIWDTGRIFNRLAGHLEARGHRCFCPDMPHANAAGGIAPLARLMADRIEREFAPRAPFALIGFSLGTIVARCFLQECGGAARVSHFFSISGPHRGTLCAHLWPGKAARDLRFGSRLLNRLNADLSPLEALQATSYHTPWDLLIVPSSSSIVPWADNVQMPALFHHRMVVQDELITHIAAQLPTV